MKKIAYFYFFFLYYVLSLKFQYHHFWNFLVIIFSFFFIWYSFYFLKLCERDSYRTKKNFCRFLLSFYFVNSINFCDFDLIFCIQAKYLVFMFSPLNSSKLMLSSYSQNMLEQIHYNYARVSKLRVFWSRVFLPSLPIIKATLFFTSVNMMVNMMVPLHFQNLSCLYRSRFWLAYLSFRHPS